MRDDHLSGDVILALVEGELPEDARRDALDHIDGCAECADAVSAQRALRDAVSATLDVTLDHERAPESMRFDPRPRHARKTLTLGLVSAAAGVALTVGALALADAWRAPTPREEVGRAAAEPARPVVETDGAIPESWSFHASGQEGCVAGTAHGIAHDGEVSSYLHTREPDGEGFCTLSQFVHARDWHGRRVRLSAWARADGIRGWAGLWMRVDGQTQDVLAFDNMQSRPIQGTRGWRRYEVVLDVPEGASLVVFGALLHGAGKLWFDDVALDPVSADTPTTDVIDSTPRNLDFESVDR